MIVACVRTGQKYGVEYVLRLKSAVVQHLPMPHRFVCITDNPQELPSDIETIQVKNGLHGWWGKMQLFEPSWRAGQRVVYFDLDTVPVGDLAPLADLDVPFGICDNFARLAGGDWPCAYNSSVMTISPEFGADMWEWFNKHRQGIMQRYRRTGDQSAIEEWTKDATLLQYALPPGFFIGYRELQKHKMQPPEASIVVFAGSHKPHNTDCAWAREAWAA